MGRLADEKAKFLNEFVTRHDIRSVVELGCGDGQQLVLSEYPKYIGLDVAPMAIEECIRVCQSRETYSFFLYHPSAFHDACGVMKSELGLSLDVIYHLTEEQTFISYMHTLFSVAGRYVICYTRDISDSGHELPSYKHIRHWPVKEWVESNEPAWTFVERVPNRWPFDPKDPANTSISDFYIFARK